MVPRKNAKPRKTRTTAKTTPATRAAERGVGVYRASPIDSLSFMYVPKGARTGRATYGDSNWEPNGEITRSQTFKMSKKELQNEYNNALHELQLVREQLQEAKSERDYFKAHFERQSLILSSVAENLG